MGDNDADDDRKDAAEEGEEDTDAADDADESSSEKGADDKDASDDDAGDDDGNSDEDEPDDDDDSDGKGSSKKDKEGEQDEDDEEDDEPPTRKPKTPADYVAERRGRKIAKLSGKGEKGGKGKDAASKGGDADDGDEDEDGLAPEDAAAIDKRVVKALAPVFAKEEQKEVETQIAAFTSKNPDFKPFASKVQKWALHDAWKNVPIEQIFYAAAGKDLMRIGAKRGKGADENARKGRTGNSGSDSGDAKSWHDTPLEDVGKEIERIKMGGK